jgi:C4-dicarboxylate-specific signal transduction histidine kinase
MTVSINIDRWRGPSPILCYGLAVLAVTGATIIQHFFDRHFAVTPSFLCAVLFSGWFGGLGPGLFGTALSILALKYYFVPPTRTFAIDTEYIPSLALFSLAALFTTWLSARERDATKSLIRARDQLDFKVCELENSNKSLQTEITARERAEEELDQLRSELAHVTRVTTLGEFAASIAHEINQPIGAAIAYANAALNWLDPERVNLEEVRRAIGRIVEASVRAGNVIDRIRALVKKAPTRKDRVDINDAVLEIVELTRGEMAKNAISIQMQLAERVSAVWGDRVQLQQVILNLLINAIEAMSASEGSRNLQISTRASEPNGVLVVVRDSGPGLAPDSADRLFDPFYTTKTGGLGMGLSISRSIVEAHRGQLWAGANFPRGAIFEFSLPTCPDVANRPVVASAT